MTLLKLMCFVHACSFHKLSLFICFPNCKSPPHQMLGFPLGIGSEIYEVCQATAINSYSYEVLFGKRLWLFSMMSVCVLCRLGLRSCPKVFVHLRLAPVKVCVCVSYGVCLVYIWPPELSPDLQLGLASIEAFVLSLGMVSPVLYNQCLGSHLVTTTVQRQYRYADESQPSKQLLQHCRCRE